MRYLYGYIEYIFQTASDQFTCTRFAIVFLISIKFCSFIYLYKCSAFKEQALQLNRKQISMINETNLQFGLMEWANKQY